MLHSPCVAYSATIEHMRILTLDVTKRQPHGTSVRKLVDDEASLCHLRHHELLAFPVLAPHLAHLHDLLVRCRHACHGPWDIIGTLELALQATLAEDDGTEGVSAGYLIPHFYPELNVWPGLNAQSEVLVEVVASTLVAVRGLLHTRSLHLIRPITESHGDRLRRAPILTVQAITIRSRTRQRGHVRPDSVQIWGEDACRREA
mmetsp:Transcript_52095/g.121152  ORF Transcript_52095/g.121152 Transcript_52095/m.121152 type:complete len:203 (-) Transcript_52095:1369-1977(-)